MEEGLGDGEGFFDPAVVYFDGEDAVRSGADDRLEVVTESMRCWRDEGECRYDLFGVFLKSVDFVRLVIEAVHMVFVDPYVIYAVEEFAEVVGVGFHVFEKDTFQPKFCFHRFGNVGR